MKNKVLVIGPVTKDIQKTPTDTYTQIGGASYYIMWTLHQLKTEATAIITIGKNNLKMINEFPEKKDIKIIKKDTTTEYTNNYTKNNKRTQKAILPPNHITIKDIENTNVDLHKYSIALICPLSKKDILPDTIKYLKENNLKILLLVQGLLRTTDENNNVINSCWNNKDSYLHNTDIISLDNAEMKIAFNLKEITTDTINKIISKYNLDTIIITDGKKGSDIYTKNNKIHIPAITTDKPIDYTGLGDTYTASYISYILKGKTKYESGLYASITAKYKLENKGHMKTEKETIEKEFEKIKLY